MKPTRDRLWFVRAVFCLLGVILLSLPAQAIADSPVPGGVGDVVDEVTQGAGEAVDDVVEGAGDVVDPVTEEVSDAAGTVTEGAGEVVEGAGDVVEGAGDVVEGAGDVVEGAGEVVEGAGDVVEGAGDVVDEATETVDAVVGGAADDVTDGTSEVAGTVGGVVNGAAGSAVASSPTASSNGHGGGGSSEPTTTTSGSAVGGGGSAFPVGGARWMRREVDRPYFRWDFSADVLGLWVPSAQTVEGGPSSEDPCDDEQLVCLGLLYGLGDFADTPAQVLGFLATTGIGVIALMMLATGLGIAGSTALVRSRRFGSTAMVGRAG